MPRKSVAPDHRTGSRGSPAAGDIDLGPFVVLFPAGANGVYPPPSRVELVSAHEQGEVSFHRVHEQPFIGIEAPGLECFAQVERETHGLQTHAFTRVLGEY